MTTLDETLTPFAVQAGAGEAIDMETLRAALLLREDNIVTTLHLAGAQFGLMPWIVAEVIAQVGLGTPPSEEERTLIRGTFVAGMEELRRRQAEGGNN